MKVWQRGDVVTFEIMKKKYDEDLYEEDDVTVSVEDLINESDADRPICRRRTADWRGVHDQLQPFPCGGP